MGAEISPTSNTFPVGGGEFKAIEFSLPPELEAAEPPEARGLRRDQVRLMVSNHSTGTIRHARFHDLPDFLDEGDAVVINTSGTRSCRPACSPGGWHGTWTALIDTPGRGILDGGTALDHGGWKEQAFRRRASGESLRSTGRSVGRAPGAIHERLRSERGSHRRRCGLPA